jgi:hypothetical protein
MDGSNGQHSHKQELAATHCNDAMLEAHDFETPVAHKV